MNTRRVLFLVLACFIFLFSATPIIWQAVSSLKDTQELYSVPVVYLPSRICLDAYAAILANSTFRRALQNSILVSLVTTVVCLAIAILTGYAVSRFKMRGRTGLQFLLLLVCLFPQIIFLIPLYELMARAGFINKPLALVVPYVTFSLPLAVWMMAGFFQTIPREIEEQAMVDGFSRLRILHKIILPLSWPAVATCGILIFIGPFAWNEFMFALTYMMKDTARTVPVGIALLSGGSMYEVPWSQICAAIIITTVPLVVVIFLFQKRIVEGLTKGAVKG